jgi:hypothetical protein
MAIIEMMCGVEQETVPVGLSIGSTWKSKIGYQ